ncbi:MAG: Dihydrolipoyllysine-residue acetyltransferase component of acetoin cleaving system [Alphaproteobacteria bacterium MarineAlpha10_Bin1]|nr:MAG: Dihydrolipoyllysine-residue acetyltransferase component of acetoin cleaving system [Alphaproteobacteria bacterium MarineAlpha10_Bin1]
MSDSIRAICMPKWGLSMKEGTVAAWLMDEGDEISPGDEVMDVDTEKISSAVEASENGILRRQIASEGDTLSVGDLLGVLADSDTSDADIDAFVTEFQANYVPPADDEDDGGAATETVDVDGRSIRYLLRGEGGVPIILVHGFGGDLNNWLFNHEALAAKRAVYALDLPGHGASSKDVGDGGVTALAAVVSGFMAALDIDKAHLVGHSLGGAIALSVALDNADKVASLTLIGSAGLGAEIDGDYLQGFIAAERRKDLKPHVEKLFSDPALVTRQLINDLLAFKRIDGVQAALETIMAAFAPGGSQALVMRDRVGDVAVPVMAIWGSGDRIVPASHAEGLPGNVRTEVMSGQGHMVQMEAASEVNKLIDELIG